MKIYKITEAGEYLGVSINTLKTLADNGKIKSFKTKRRKLRLKVNQSNLMEFEKEVNRSAECNHGWKLVHGCNTN